MIGDDKIPKTCTVTFNIEKNMKQPIYVYYGLDNFYQVLFIDLQNHRKYVQSRSDSQLNGKQLDAKDLDDCEPLVYADDGRILSPCGLAANSFFNDTFTISGENADIEMYESDISWKSDREKKFKNPTNRDTARYKYLYINLYIVMKHILILLMQKEVQIEKIQIIMVVVYKMNILLYG